MINPIQTLARLLGPRPRNHASKTACARRGRLRPPDACNARARPAYSFFEYQKAPAGAQANGEASPRPAARGAPLPAHPSFQTIIPKAFPVIALLTLALLAPAHLPLAAQTNDTTGTAAAPAGKTTRAKKAAVKVGQATVVSGDDTAPRLISRTGGSGADTMDYKAPAWRNFAELQKAADAKNPDACFELGQRYLNGTPDTPKNPVRARLYLEDAAALGHADANFRLGKLYADGELIPQDYAKALAHYTAAARAGVTEAQHNLGAMYASARGVKRDYVEGLAWLIIAAGTNPEARASETKLRDHLDKSKRLETIYAAEDRAKKLAAELATAASERIEQPSHAAPAASDPLMDATKPKPLNVPITPLPKPAAPMPPPVHNW